MSRRQGTTLPWDKMRTVQVLINLIARVGGTQNIRKWMDEIIKMEIEETTMKASSYKVNVSELHLDIQKKLASHLKGKLREGMLTISQNPDEILWEEVELAVYISIDSDSDRLIEKTLDIN